MSAASIWEEKKWSVLAAFSVGLLTMICFWWAAAGPSDPQAVSGAGGAVAVPSLEALNAMADPAIRTLGLEIAWYFMANGRLPRDLSDLRVYAMPPSWPMAPETTAAGQPIGYRPLGLKRYNLVLPGSDGRLRTADDLVLPHAVPAQLPRGSTPRDFHLWFNRKQDERLDEIRARLESDPGR